MVEPTNKPILQVRSGNVSASVFSNITTQNGKTFSFETVNIQKGYKVTENGKDVWKNTNSFGLKDLHKVVLCIEAIERQLLLNDNREE